MLEGAQRDALHITQAGDSLIVAGCTNRLDAPGVWMTLDMFLDGTER